MAFNSSGSPRLLDCTTSAPTFLRWSSNISLSASTDTYEAGGGPTLDSMPNNSLARSASSPLISASSASGMSILPTT